MTVLVTKEALVGGTNNRLIYVLIVISFFLHSAIIFSLTDVHHTPRRSSIELTIEEFKHPVSHPLPVLPARPQSTSPLPERADQQVVSAIRPIPQIKALHPPVWHQEPQVQPDIPQLPETWVVKEVREPAPVAAEPPVSSLPVKTSLTPDDQSVFKYLADIRSRIERYKKYPLAARSRRLEGEVSIRFFITPEGVPQALTICKSSGQKVLDQAALKAIQDASPFPRPPGDILKAKIPLKLTIIFKLS